MTLVSKFPFRAQKQMSDLGGGVSEKSCREMYEALDPARRRLVVPLYTDQNDVLPTFNASLLGPKISKMTVYFTKVIPSTTVYMWVRMQVDGVHCVKIYYCTSFGGQL